VCFLRFAAVVATDGYVTDDIYRKKWVTRGTLPDANCFGGTRTRVNESNLPHDLP
jgi:hypothetical protein